MSTSDPGDLPSVYHAGGVCHPLRIRQNVVVGDGPLGRPKDPMFVTFRSVPYRMTDEGVCGHVIRVMSKAGLRNKAGWNKKYRVPLINGFQRFWNKTCKEALSHGESLPACTPSSL